MIRMFRAACLALALCCHWSPTLAERPPEWAQSTSVEGIPNLHRVTPHIYRSAQPTALGMRKLEEVGVRTVINLRSYHDDSKVLAGTHIRQVRIPVNTWDIRDAQVVAVLRELKREKNGLILIHCQHGADRTGLMSAMYRIVVEGWDKQRAIDEMIQGGYGYHVVWRNILKYIKDVDVDKIRRAVDQ